ATSRLLLFVAALATLWTFGSGFAGGCGPTDPTPCELDRLGCDPTEDPDFYLASCPTDVMGELEVEVGTGESSFEPFSEGGGPIVHYGPQGGQHVFLGARVKNARLDVSPKLKFTFYVGEGEGCAPPQSGEDGEEPACARRLGGRSIVFGAPGFEVRKNANGEVEEYGLVVFVDVPATVVAALVSVTVEDPCRRKGAAHQVWTRF
ncbi:MAG TPA: hypothetical protein PK095_11900, partial [Myxococcota bacterium]|nr:hypothetical protein [Myxococcota bacterium]